MINWHSKYLHHSIPKLIHECVGRLNFKCMCVYLIKDDHVYHAGLHTLGLFLLAGLLSRDMVRALRFAPSELRAPMLFLIDSILTYTACGFRLVNALKIFVY